MQMFMTAAKAKTDMIRVGLYIALELICKRDNRNFITGLQKITQAGRGS